VKKHVLVLVLIVVAQLTAVTAAFLEWHYRISPPGWTCGINRGACLARWTPTAGFLWGQWKCEQVIAPSPEKCNGMDDDCDGQTDEGFDLRRDVHNCGKCGIVCLGSQNTCQNGACTDGGCIPSNGGIEVCDDIDNDCNGWIDETGLKDGEPTGSVCATPK